MLSSVLYDLALHDALPICGIGALVLLYCAWYFSRGARYLNRFAACFVAFAGAMLGLVTTDNTMSLFVLWGLRSEEHTSGLRARGHLVCRLSLGTCKAVERT